MKRLYFPYELEDIYWLRTLPQNERDFVSDLLASNPSEKKVSETIQFWFSNITTLNINTIRNEEFYMKVKKELFMFLCGDPKYDLERKRIKFINETLNWEFLLVSFISAALGSQLGITEHFIAPVVVIIFIMISKISINAWCEMKE